MKNPAIAHELAVSSSDFSMSSLANDVDILSLEADGGLSVAASLAKNQPKWVESRNSSHLELLKLPAMTVPKYQGVSIVTTAAHEMIEHHLHQISKELLSNMDFLTLNSSGRDLVAHHIAKVLPEWLDNPITKSFSTLSIRNSGGETVAHKLAKYQPQWSLTEDAQSTDVLLLKDNQGVPVARELLAHQPTTWDSTVFASVKKHLKLKYTVGFGITVTFGHELAENENWAKNSPSAFKKDILTMTVAMDDDEDSDVSIAEMLKIPKNEAVVRVIKTGAAFKPSSSSMCLTYPEPVFDLIMSDVYELAEEASSGIVALKLLLALYSTIDNLKWLFNATEDHRLLCERKLTNVEGVVTALLLKEPKLTEKIHSLTDKNWISNHELISRMLSYLIFENGIEEAPTHQDVATKSFVGMNY